MEWSRQIDAYCERLGPGLWAEPVNAVTNLAFVLAALWAWRAARGGPAGRAGMARLLAAVLGAIGIGSFLFHTVATPWAALADTLPIALFILVYIYAANRYFWGLGPVWALLGTGLALPVLVLGGWAAGQVPGLAVSAPYWPVAALIAGYALALAPRDPGLARGLGAGAALLALSITARSLDEALCAAWPLGTHFGWHLLNALMLGWMIRVLLRHGREG